MHKGKWVEKDDLPDGTRTLTVEGVVYTEEPAPFPLGKSQLDEDPAQQVKELCEEFKIASPKAIGYVDTVVRMSLSKGGTSVKAIKKSVRVFLVAMQDILEEQETLDSALPGMSPLEIFEDMVRSGGEDNAVLKALKALPGMPEVETQDPRLARIAETLEKAGILESPTFKAARTDEEYFGCVGEYLTHQQIGDVMKLDQSPTLDKGEEVLQLHSVHFYGFRFEGDSETPSKSEETDACSELDLMTVVRTESGEVTCIAVGNTKVSGSSRASEARHQNQDAIVAIKAHSGKEKLALESKPGVKILVNRVEGQIVGDNKKIDLKGIKLSPKPTEKVIGTHGSGTRATTPRSSRPTARSVPLPSSCGDVHESSGRSDDGAARPSHTTRLDRRRAARRRPLTGPASCSTTRSCSARSSASTRPRRWRRSTTSTHSTRTASPRSTPTTTRT